jgi:hypothetical protein
MGLGMALENTAIGLSEFKFFFVQYQPRPDLGKFGSRLNLAPVGFPSKGGFGKMWLREIS